MFRKRRKGLGAASDDQRKLHGRMIRVLYGHRTGNVTPLGTYRTMEYRTNWGRKRG